MRLLIDIGNTRIKWLLIQGSEKLPQTVQAKAITHHQKFNVAIEECFGSESEFAQLMSTLLVSSPTEVLASNVAGEQAKAALFDFSKKNWHKEVYFSKVERERLGIRNSYAVLSELGVDRWMAILGARQVFPQDAVIIINCGTAMVVDVLNADNNFLGGAILPGFQLAAKSLSRADGINRFEAAPIKKLVGVRTSECVQLGVISACVGGVEFMVEKIRQELDGELVNILISGGAAELFLGATSLECEYDANVVMRGLNRIIECE